MKKVTKPASGYTSGFCGFRLRLIAADLGFAVGADDDFALCGLVRFAFVVIADYACRDDFAYRVDCDFVVLALLRFQILKNWHLRNYQNWRFHDLRFCRFRIFHFRQFSV